MCNKKKNFLSILNLKLYNKHENKFLLKGVFMFENLTKEQIERFRAEKLERHHAKLTALKEISTQLANINQQLVKLNTHLENKH